MGKQEKFVQDFKLEPINVKKALDTLDLDPKAESKLAKALVGTRAVMEKNLDALARELKLKTNGKQMLAALEKAKLI
jgi:ribosomal silencing factor RsfS